MALGNGAQAGHSGPNSWSSSATDAVSQYGQGGMADQYVQCSQISVPPLAPTNWVTLNNRLYISEPSSLFVKKNHQHHRVYLLRGRRDHGLPKGSAGKESPCNLADRSSIPGLGRSPGEVKGYPLQYSGLENSMDCIVHGVVKSHKEKRS